MYAFNKNNRSSDDPLVRIFSEKGDSGKALGEYLMSFFGASLWYYSKIYEEVAVNFNATPSENDTRGNLTEIGYFCQKAVDSREANSFPFNGIKACSVQLYLLQPGCEVVRDSQIVGSFETFQYKCNQLANTSGLPGGDSNRCFQKFLVRYVDYNRTIYETFVDHVGQHLFQEVAVYGYCLSIARHDSQAREEWITWAENSLKSILKEWLNGLEIFNERPSTSVPPSSSDKPSAPWSTTTAHVNEGSLTQEILERATDSVLTSEGITGSMAWAERAKRHQMIADKIYQNLTAAHNARNGVSFQVLISLLQDKDQSEMQCMESGSNRHINSSNSHGVSYFIQHFNTADLSVGLNGTWNDIQDKDDDILDAVFSSKTQDLCKTTKDEIEKAVGYKVFGSANGFSGLAVVRCGRRFVWYQLGYSYFSVGRTAGPSFTLASGNGETYNSSCGQIFLFP